MFYTDRSFRNNRLKKGCNSSPRRINRGGPASPLKINFFNATMASLITVFLEENQTDYGWLLMADPSSLFTQYPVNNSNDDAICKITFCFCQYAGKTRRAVAPVGVPASCTSLKNGHGWPLCGENRPDSVFPFCLRPWCLPTLYELST